MVLAGPWPPASIRLGSPRSASVRLASPRFASVRLGSPRFASVHASVRLGSPQFTPRFASVRLGSRLGSPRFWFHSPRFSSVLLGSLVFSLVLPSCCRRCFDAVSGFLLVLRNFQGFSEKPKDFPFKWKQEPQAAPASPSQQPAPASPSQPAPASPSQPQAAPARKHGGPRPSSPPTNPLAKALRKD